MAVPPLALTLSAFRADMIEVAQLPPNHGEAAGEARQIPAMSLFGY